MYTAQEGWQFVGIEFNPRSQAASNGPAGPSHIYRPAWIRSLLHLTELVKSYLRSVFAIELGAHLLYGDSFA